MANTPPNEPEKHDGGLPSPEEIGARFGAPAKAQWEKAKSDAHRRAMLKQWEALPPKPSVNRDEAARDALRTLLDSHDTYVRTESGERELREHKTRYEEDLARMKDPAAIAARVLQLHMIDALLRGNGYMDFSDVRDVILADPRCAPIARSVTAMYNKCVEIFVERGLIERETFDDDDEDEDEIDDATPLL